MKQNQQSRPARPEKLGFRFERDDEGLAVVYSIRGKGGGFFMLLWLTGWTVGCVALAGMVINDPKIFHFLFAIPFWASWVFVFFMMMRSFFGREYFLLDRGGASYISRVLVPIRTRLIPIEEIKSFHECEMSRDSESGHITLGVEMRTLGKSLRFAGNISHAECEWLVDQLNDSLRSLGGGANAADEVLPALAEGDEREIEPPKVEFSKAEKTEADESDRCVLSLAKTPREPPSDCRWRRIDDFDSTAFLQRGRLALGTLGGLLFINLFWNGIVSVFLACLLGLMPGNNNQPVGPMWWGMCVFLIPFEVIGLLMFLALVCQLFEPVRRTRWKFGKQEIECRWTWFGLGRTWLYPVKPLDRLEIRVSNCNKKSQLPQPRNFFDSGGEGANRPLIFVDRENAEFCSIKGLTEGEARWIGDFVLRERESWFE